MSRERRECCSCRSRSLVAALCLLVLVLEKGLRSFSPRLLFFCVLLAFRSPPVCFFRSGFLPLCLFRPGSARLLLPPRPLRFLLASSSVAPAASLFFVFFLGVSCCASAEERLLLPSLVIQAFALFVSSQRFPSRGQQTKQIPRIQKFLDISFCKKTKKGKRRKKTSPRQKKPEREKKTFQTAVCRLLRMMKTTSSHWSSVAILFLFLFCFSLRKSTSRIQGYHE